MPLIGLTAVNNYGTNLKQWFIFYDVTLAYLICFVRTISAPNGETQCAKLPKQLKTATVEGGSRLVLQGPQSERRENTKLESFS